MPSFTVFKGQASGIIRESTTTKPDELVGDNVLVRVTASGLCGTGTSLITSIQEAENMR
jgi:threonine dehydrogenase-like Zn-dependent dehydrogenase